MSGIIDTEKLREHVVSGIVRATAHPSLPLTIYNYTERCQYEKLWDDLATQCRGLIMCGDSIVARPFRKFFNDTEHAESEVPWHLPSEITEKMDGSLLIVFHFGGEWRAATRGSFTSEQAERGLHILNERYGFTSFCEDVTYLFEVIYPANRIVVNYGMRSDVVLLGMIHTVSGDEIPLDLAPGHLTVVRRLRSDASPRELRSLIGEDEEGYVVRFANGFRVKVKGERYMQLHRAISGLSSRMVWEHLSRGQDLAELLAVVPDEFAEWIRGEQVEHTRNFQRLRLRASAAVADVKSLATRKEQALRIKDRWGDVSAAAFQLLDSRDPSATIWKAVYPELRRPESSQRLVGECK